MTSEKTARKDHAIDMTEGSPYRLILRFAVPLLLGNLFQQLYNTVDSIIVGNYLGTRSLAAVGVGFPFLFTMVSFFMGLGIAATVLISQRFGAKDFDGVNIIANTIYRVASTIILPIVLIGIFATPYFLEHLLRVPDDGTLVQGTAYLQILFAGMAATMGYNLNAGILQGLGDSVTSLKFLITSSVLNIVLDLLFVAVFKMGVAGAAWATIIAQFIAWLLGLRYLNRHYEYISLNLLHLSFDRDYFKQSVRLGIPMAIQNMLFSIGAMAMYSLINSYGSTFSAGFNAANKIDTLVFLPVQSFANAVTTYTGQNAGARRFDRIHQGTRAGLVISTITALVMGVVCYISSDLLMSMFGNDAGMIAAGSNYLHSVLPFYIFLAILFTMNSVLRGVNQVALPLFSTILSLLLGRVPVAYYLAATMGKDMIFYSYGVGWIAGCTLSVCFYLFGSWEEKLHLFHQQEDERAARRLSEKKETELEKRVEAIDN